MVTQADLTQDKINMLITDPFFRQKINELFVEKKLVVDGWHHYAYFHKDESEWAEYGCPICKMKTEGKSKTGVISAQICPDEGRDLDELYELGCPNCCCDSWEECTCCCGKAATEQDQ